ncbi:MAG: hypothetical protein ABSH28_03165 [Acidobacteriota bacterium]|jgi:hypothetical protein
MKIKLDENKSENAAVILNRLRKMIFIGTPGTAAPQTLFVFFVQFNSWLLFVCSV